jgi:hypothetical protein
MFRTSYVHHQEKYIVHSGLYFMFFHALMQAVCEVEGCARHFEHILQPARVVPPHLRLLAVWCNYRFTISYKINLPNRI